MYGRVKRKDEVDLRFAALNDGKRRTQTPEFFSHFLMDNKKSREDCNVVVHSKRTFDKNRWLIVHTNENSLFMAKDGTVSRKPKITFNSVVDIVIRFDRIIVQFKRKLHTIGFQTPKLISLKVVDEIDGYSSDEDCYTPEGCPDSLVFATI